VSEQTTRLTAAEAVLAALAKRGVEYLYVNAGTDFASIVEAYAARESHRSGSPRLAFPTPVVCLHENLAVGMAHGYALASGKPQAVMVHVSVGTANCVCGLMNAARDQVPLLLAAGRTPLYERGRRGARDAPIHWAQEMFDQGGLVRELVKWDYELRDGMQAELVIDRALAIARAPPPGPVYLTLPREVLAQEIAADDLASSETAVPGSPAPDPADVERLAHLIAAAELPIILTSGSGAVSASQALQTQQALGQFVQRFGIGVVEYLSRRVQLPSSHPLYLGTHNQVALERADLILVVDTDVPWIPTTCEPRPDTRVVHIGVDPLFAHYPIRTFRTDLALATTLEQLLPPLAAALDHRAAVGATDYGARAQRVQELAAARRAELAARRKRIAAEGRLTRAWLTMCLNAAVSRDTSIVNEYWIERELLDRELPGTWFATPPAGGRLLCVRESGRVPSGRGRLETARAHRGLQQPAVGRRRVGRPRRVSARACGRSGHAGAAQQSRACTAIREIYRGFGRLRRARDGPEGAAGRARARGTRGASRTPSGFAQRYLRVRR